MGLAYLYTVCHKLHPTTYQAIHQVLTCCVEHHINSANILLYTLGLNASVSINKLDIATKDQR